MRKPTAHTWRATVGTLVQLVLEHVDHGHVVLRGAYTGYIPFIISGTRQFFTYPAVPWKRVRTRVTWQSRARRVTTSGNVTIFSYGNELNLENMNVNT